MLRHKTTWQDGINSRVAEPICDLS